MGEWNRILHKIDSAEIKHGGGLGAHPLFRLDAAGLDGANVAANPDQRSNRGNAQVGRESSPSPNLTRCGESSARGRAASRSRRLQFGVRG